MFGDYSGDGVEKGKDYDKNYNCIKYLIFTIDVVLFVSI